MDYNTIIKWGITFLRKAGAMSRMTLSEKIAIRQRLWWSSWIGWHLCLDWRPYERTLSPYDSDWQRVQSHPWDGIFSRKKTENLRFYCDPQASWKQPHIEKNHEYIRYVLPRGKSFKPYAQQDILFLPAARRGKRNKRGPLEHGLFQVSTRYNLLSSSLVYIHFFRCKLYCNTATAFYLFDKSQADFVVYQTIRKVGLDYEGPPSGFIWIYCVLFQK